ncbi:MAG: hypothetical protein R3C49_02715 [Planctomycetaceae bacterium]
MNTSGHRHPSPLAACQHRQFLPVTDDVVRRHLSGRDAAGADFTAGVYPMLLEKTCFFLAMDFDKSQVVC